MNTYLTISDQAIAAATSCVSSPAPLTGPARIAEPTAARIAQSSDIRTSWPTAGVMPVGTRAALQHQGGRLAEFGGADVTDPKFSTRVGPPCSPPV